MIRYGVIDKLLFRAIAPPFVITFAVLTFVVSAREFGRLSELLITKNASPDVMVAVVGAILPEILIYSLPLSFLIGVLVGIGGISGESQTLALRACGVPLRRLLSFILIFGAVIGAITALLSLAVVPGANDYRAQLVDRVSVSVATTRIQARVFNEDLPNVIFYIRDLSDDKQRLSGIFLAEGSDSRAPKVVVAGEAFWVRDPDNRRIQLHLEHGASYSTADGEPERDTQSFFSSTDIPIEIRRLTAADQNENSENVAATRPVRVRELETLDLWRERASAAPEENSKRIIELNRRVALPFSVLPFSILGLALAVSAPKSGRTLGFGLGLAAVIIFYMLFANGVRMASVGKISPWLGPWMANITLFLTGIFLLSIAEKRFALSHWITTIPRLRPTCFRRSRVEETTCRARINGVSYYERARIYRISQIPKIMDVYILRGFLTYFLWSLVACTTLFLLLTVFELLDDIIRNSISPVYLVDYLIFLTPQVLMVVIPTSILLAVLINLGAMENNSEITAIKASGWSLYRLSLPIVTVSAFFSLSLFFMQDYILPYANNRQDNLRSYILNKPARTSTRPDRKWILGDQGRIYNYEYFDSSQNLFVNLNVYDVDFNSSRLQRRIYAEHARVGDGIWTLENGWLRDYESPEFERFEKKAAHFPERAGYFKREIFQPTESSKLTYFELRQYISHLRQSGYNAVGLQVELHKKAAFPASCLIMALVGTPFAFSAGRKGAFYGIGVSIAIAIIYWGVSGAFEAMGSYGMLIPFLAAWSPNILFAAAGLTLFLTVRT